LLLQAQEVRELGQPKLITYDNSAETDIIWGLGLGCNGKIEILLEPLQRDDPTAFEIIYHCYSARRTGILATVIHSEDPSRLAARYLCDETGEIRHTEYWDKTIDLDLFISESIDQKTTRKKPQIIEIFDSKILIEYLQRETQLVVIGAGPDAVPLVQLADQLGWQVDVFDHREAFARIEYFSTARSVSVYPVSDIPRHVQADNRTAVVLMTHHYLHDLELLKLLITSDAGYIGALGPKARLELLLDDIHKADITPSADQLQRLRGPVGLNLGAETPQEIALSIVAEIQACFTQQNAAPLNNSLKPIHD
jgi:xanthine/CO dehydrogenase XdhC/CoxF family maturation factor